MKSTGQIAAKIRRITSRIIEETDEATLCCAIDGSASGIPAAFVDALDRVDKSGESSESLHELLVEYARAVAATNEGTIPRTVILGFKQGQTTIGTE